MRDPYVALGVRPTADFEVIKAAYRALARRHHPDAGGDTARMAAINDAYAVLADGRLRKAYDAARAIPVYAYDVPTPPQAQTRRPDVLDFGRYEGWSIGQLAHRDPDYLEWLYRAPIGRAYCGQIERALQARRASRQAVATPPRPRRRGIWRR